MKILALSDTHWSPEVGQFVLKELPTTDLAVYAGDACLRGDSVEFSEFVRWFGTVPATHKIFVPGNHDWVCERQPTLARELCTKAGITLLEDEGINVEGKLVWGTPWQPRFCNWAFNANPKALATHYAKIPKGIDILVTHCPPLDVLDTVIDRWKCGDRVGSPELAVAVNRTQPKVHIFGHIHGSHGRVTEGTTQFYNVAICDEDYVQTNPVTIIELP